MNAINFPAHRTPGLPHTDLLAALEEVASAQPNRTAVVDESQRLNYRQLWSLVCERARTLTGAGVTSGDRIAIVAESSAHYLATVLAVWRAGASIVTIFPSSGSSDMRYSVELSDPVLLFTDGRSDLSAVPLAEMGLPVASIEDFSIPHLRTGAAPTPETVRQQLAMICFSSGTTSRPKAIMVSTLAIYNTAQTYREVWHLTSDDTTVVALPLAWMYGLASTTLATLVGGGTVVLLRRGRPELVASMIERESATFLPGVTATFARLADIAREQPDWQWFKTLRFCISGGEPRNEAAFERFKQATGTAVLDAYCASECLPLVTYDPTTDAAPRIGSAGKLVPRAELKVLRENGTDVEVGEVGEAFSAGPGLMLGYWGDPEASRAAITFDGWYRTQDLVKVDEDGYVFVVGRLSDLIIRGGTNISPAEVEAVLREHPDVADAGVVGLPDETYGQVVVAAVVPRGGAVLDTDDLVKFARQRLAPYKVPSRVITVSTLPVGTTGKVSRKELVNQLLDADA